MTEHPLYIMLNQFNCLKQQILNMCTRIYFGYLNLDRYFAVDSVALFLSDCGSVHVGISTWRFNGQRKRKARINWRWNLLLSIGWLLELYILSISNVISQQIPICDSAHSWWLYKAAPTGNQAVGTITQYSTHSYYPDTEKSTPCPIILSG